MRQKIIVILFIAFLATGNSIWATIVLQLDTEGLTLRSDTIITGTVARPPKPILQGDLILSEITIQVDEVVKSEPGVQEASFVKIKQLGGTYNGRSIIVPGMPSFRTSERVLLFLRKSKAEESYAIVGLAQGKYEIQTDSDTGKEVVLQKSLFSSLPVKYSKQRVGFNAKLLTTTPGSQGKGTTRTDKRLLSDFIREIKAYENPDTPDKLSIERNRK